MKSEKHTYPLRVLAVLPSLLLIVPGVGWGCIEDWLGIDASLCPSSRRTWLAEKPLPAAVPYYSLVTYPHPDRISLS